MSTWTWRIHSQRKRFLLEFLGVTSTVWLSLLKCEMIGLVDELILVLGDNTSAICWILKSSLPLDLVYRPTVLFIARIITALVVASHNFIVSQHLPGLLNLIVDWLSLHGTEQVQHGTPKQNPVAFDCPLKVIVAN